MFMRLKKYLFAILFYFIGCVLVTIPVVLAFIKPADRYFLFVFFRDIFVFKFNPLMIIILAVLFGIIIMIDCDILIKSETVEKNVRNIEILLGQTNNIPLNFVLCLFTGYFEETLFRGILYSFILIFFQLFVQGTVPIVISVALTSMIFALFHITQGKIGLIASFIISIIFFISIFITRTIWYAVAVHFLFNFIELSFIFPYQKKKICQD
jgi:membrane protease YdiL (CAAX protease family)